MNDLTPDILCTLDEKSECNNCVIQNKLACKWDKKIKNCFAAIGFPPILIAIVGMVIIGKVTGAWWPLIAYVVYFISMFSVFEIRFLCSQCVNFSCALNTVPKHVVDEYLKRNPVMKEAWEKCGYIIES